jgi:hypothetical protein
MVESGVPMVAWTIKDVSIVSCWIKVCQNALCHQLNSLKLLSLQKCCMYLLGLFAKATAEPVINVDEFVDPFKEQVTQEQLECKADDEENCNMHH